jgi:dethiobiotin synthetase
MSHAPKGFFLTGTDTGVGKTFVARALIRALAREGVAVAGMKPVAAGAEQTPQGLRNEDALALLEAGNVAAQYDEVNPYCLPAPVSPHIAAREAGITIDINNVLRAFEALASRSDRVVVEGAGGWLVPLSDRHTLADLAIALHLPVVMVVGLRLGCLNHALLTAQAISASGLTLAGWIGNHIDPEFERAAENLYTLQQRLGAEPAWIVPFGIDPSAAARLCSEAARRLAGLPRASAGKVPPRPQGF